MNKLVLLTLLNEISEEKLQEQEVSPIRGSRGFRGAPGRSFDFEEHEETIKSWVQEFSLKFENLTGEQIELLRGPAGTDGKPFNFSDNKEEIEKTVREFVSGITDKLKLKFSDLTDQEQDLIKGRQGKDGRDGRDGKDFDLVEHQDSIREMVESSDKLKLKFSDLTGEQLDLIRGEVGPAGADGKAFEFTEHEARISEIISSTVNSISEKLKLRFEDLTDDERDSLRGRNGRDGRDGRSFNFDDHKEYFDSLKFKFDDFTGEELEKLKLKFSDLSEDEKDGLRLKFNQLTLSEKLELKGPRGQRGRNGAQGEIGLPGDKGDIGEAGPRGEIGPRGNTGIRGLPGPTGAMGPRGAVGAAAPFITDIEVQELGKEMRFQFYFSDGSVTYSNWFEMPTKVNGQTYLIGGTGAGNNSNNAPASGAIFEDFAVSLVANVWQTVTPTLFSRITDFEVYDAFGAERVEMDSRMAADRSYIELRSKKSLTFNVFIEGAN